MKGRSIWQWRNRPQDWKRFIESRGGHRLQRNFLLAHRTPAERKLSKVLRRLREQTGLKCRERHPVLGAFFADFYHSSGVVIEIDVERSLTDEQRIRETARTVALEEAKFVIVSVSERDVLRRPKLVLDRIVDAVESRRNPDGGLRRHPNRASRPAGTPPDAVRVNRTEAAEQSDAHVGAYGSVLRVCHHCQRDFRVAEEYVAHVKTCLHALRDLMSGGVTPVNCPPPRPGIARWRLEEPSMEPVEVVQADAHVVTYRSITRVCLRCNGVFYSDEDIAAHRPAGCARQGPSCPCRPCSGAAPGSTHHTLTSGTDFGTEEVVEEVATQTRRSSVARRGDRDLETGDWHPGHARARHEGLVPPVSPYSPPPRSGRPSLAVLSISRTRYVLREPSRVRQKGDRHGSRDSVETTRTVTCTAFANEAQSSATGSSFGDPTSFGMAAVF